MIDALQLANEKEIPMPADWRPRDKVIIPTSITNEAARDIFPQGWDEIHPYLPSTKVCFFISQALID